MPKLCVRGVTISLDGYMAGPDQSLEQPLGLGAGRLHEWIFATDAGRRMIGEDPADDGSGRGVDDDFFARGVAGIGATVMGRNMFGPVRGPWESGFGDPGNRSGNEWDGWWGEEPPFHHPVFVLTNHPRPSLEMSGGTVFHFVTDGIEAALDRALAAAGGKDVRLGGGAATIQQYLRAGLVDEMHLAVVPILLGRGERLFDHLDGGPEGLECAEFVSSPAVAHVRFVRSARK
jgi:dihydrofolate reductase